MGTERDPNLTAAEQAADECYLDLLIAKCAQDTNPGEAADQSRADALAAFMEASKAVNDALQASRDAAERGEP